jgi:hypothetical protein
MRKLVVLILAAVGLAAGPLLRGQADVEAVPSPVADVNVYGEYPLGYKLIITRWMEERLVDPASAVFEWSGEPRPGEVSPKKGGKYVGYIVDFKVNARNRFGAPTGKQRYQVVIRNGAIVWGGQPRS